MGMEKIMAIDCGKAVPKVAIRTQEGTVEKKEYETKLIEGSDFADQVRTFDKTIHFVKYDGKAYTVGNPQDPINSSNSKMNMVHKIMTLTAIGLNVNNGDIVKVIIGCLLDVFIDEEQRKEYLNYILPDGRVEIEIDGKEVYFYITQKMCASESLGALFYIQKILQMR